MNRGRWGAAARFRGSTPASPSRFEIRNDRGGGSAKPDGRRRKEPSKSLLDKVPAMQSSQENDRSDSSEESSAQTSRVGEISLCFGSSCFARGNERNLTLIENFLQERRLETKVELSGTRCSEGCLLGPRVVVDGVVYDRVDAEKLTRILNEKFGPAPKQGDGE